MTPKAQMLVLRNRLVGQKEVVCLLFCVLLPLLREEDILIDIYLLVSRIAENVTDGF